MTEELLSKRSTEELLLLLVLSAPSVRVAVGNELRRRETRSRSAPEAPTVPAAEIARDAEDGVYSGEAMITSA